MKNKLAILTILVAGGFLIACSAITSNETQSATHAFPTPTYQFLFQVNAPAGTSDPAGSVLDVPTVASFFRLQPGATPSPSSVAASTSIPEITATQTLQPQLFTVPVYDDGLNPNWVVQKNTGVNFDLNSTTHVYRGKSAISFVPRTKTQYGSLLFTVSDPSKEMYPRDQVTTLSFWLYSGDEPLLLDQMAVTILGSNSQPFWKANDTSVSASGQDPTFSETRLYFLGFNRDIPAKTWVQVEVDLDKLIYDPNYKYVTGFYLKMEKGFSRTLWVDDINLEMLSNPSDVSTPEITPTKLSN